MYVASDTTIQQFSASSAAIRTRSPANSNTFARIANLMSADAITIAPNGTVYVVGNGQVYSWSSNNGLVSLASGFSTRVPGMVVAGDGNLYVSDLSKSVIKQVTPSGAVTVVVGTSDLPIGTAPGGLPARINSPAGLALLSSGPHVSLAVVDSFEHSVLRVDLP